jgi:hypothetical protein
MDGMRTFEVNISPVPIGDLGLLHFSPKFPTVGIKDVDDWLHPMALLFHGECSLIRRIWWL